MYHSGYHPGEAPVLIKWHLRTPSHYSDQQWNISLKFSPETLPNRNLRKPCPLSSTVNSPCYVHMEGCMYKNKICCLKQQINNPCYVQKDACMYKKCIHSLKQQVNSLCYVRKDIDAGTFILELRLMNKKIFLQSNFATVWRLMRFWEKVCT